MNRCANGKNRLRKKSQGFTLIEMLLVSVIILMIIYAATNYIQARTLQARIDRTSAQMQQILNAALSYYVMNGSWPTGNTLACLQGNAAAPCTVSYLPANMVSPWEGQAYGAVADPTGSVFYAWATVFSAGVATSSAPGFAKAVATAISGTLPLSYVTADDLGSPPIAGNTCEATATNCTVVASVNIPGQNLNNARAVNFSGLYHNGACVPVPQCPVDPGTGNSMTPQIFVVPVSVSGLYDQTNPTYVYPISSFTAYATGSGTTPTFSPAACDNASAQACPASGVEQGVPGYWRVCLQIVTEKGTLPAVATSGNWWGGDVTVMAITRCAVNNEPAGSNFTIFSN